MKASVSERLAPIFSLTLFCGLVTLYIAAGTASAEPIAGARFSVKNPIDKFIQTALVENKMEASMLSTDEEFIRRAYLDLCGVIPPGDTVRAFLDDKNPAKREKAIDTLLNSKRYAEHWATLWGDMLREQTNARNGQGTIRGSYRIWIEEALEKNMPYDQFVRALLTANGSANDNGAVNFFLRDARGNNIDSVETVNLVSGVFMGTRMSCAQCHDHPFDKWMQSDFHGLMAFFTRTRTAPDIIDTMLRIDQNEKNLPKDLAEILAPMIAKAKEYAASPERKVALNAGLAGAGDKKGKGDAMMMGMDGMEAQMAMFGKNVNLRREIETKIPKEEQQRALRVLQNNEIRQILEAPVGEYSMPTEGDSQDRRRNKGEVVKPTFPWDPSRETPATMNRRAALADHLVASRQFAAVQVNRLWSQLFGRGLIDPIDDFRPKNPATHPELLDFLTDAFVKSKFDNKQMLRLIMNSATYQLSSAPNSQNRNDKQLFSHQALKRLTAEQIFDSVLVATGRTQGIDDPKDFSANQGMAKFRRGGGTEKAQWAADIPTPQRPGSFLNTFNQPQRDQSVFERDPAGSIPQSLEMMNGSTVANAIRSSPVIAELTKSKAAAKDCVEELYLWVLSRKPSYSELAATTRFLGEAPTREGLEDLQWALINSREFMFVK